MSLKVLACRLTISAENVRIDRSGAGSEKWVRSLKDVIRTCIGCRQKFPQEVLIRFIYQRDGELKIDSPKKLGGRGAYVCLSQNCVQIAFKSPKRINSVLRVQLASEIIAEFEQMLLQWIRQSVNTTEEKEGLL